MFVQKFAKLAKQIIDKVFDIWKMGIEIVPPLEDLLDMCWKVPNQADTCCNGALNLTLPQVVQVVQPFIDMPFDAVDTIAKACDAATKLAYETPTPK